MAKRNNADYLARQRARHEANLAWERHLTQVWMLDMVTVTLGRMGWGPDRLQRFDSELNKVYEEYGRMAIRDSADDREMWVTKTKLDGELRRIVGDDRFVPYEDRYKMD